MEVVPNLLSGREENVTVADFYNHVIIIVYSSSHASKVGPLPVEASLSMWSNHFLPFKVFLTTCARWRYFYH